MFGKVRPCGAYIQHLPAVGLAQGLLLMRVVAGSALIVRAGLTLRSNPPPLSMTIPAMLLIGAGILLITGLWTPIAGRSVALTEIWKVLMYPAQVAVAGDGNRWCRPGNVRTGSMVGRRSPLWLDAPRRYTRTLTLIKRFSTYQISCLRRG
jgi:hypothetical protein